MAKRWISVLSVAATLAAGLLLVGCSGRKQTLQLEWQPDMYRQPAVEALGIDRVNGNLPAMRTPPAHTIPVNYVPFPTPYDTANVDQLINPLQPNMAVLRTGRKLFDTYCIVCHGARADGLGYVVPKMTQPPPLTIGPPLQFSDGRIFSIITGGLGNMPPYQTELQASERWAIVNYVRVLQRAANPSADDMALAAQKGNDFSHDYPDAMTPNGPEPGRLAIPHDEPSSAGGQ